MSISSTTTAPIKMLDFMTSLYAKYKVLNRLTEAESTKFQEQIVQILVDSSQNVHQQTYNSIKKDIGLDGFILEILGDVLSRNPFNNQYEMNRNLSALTESIKKEQEELSKKQGVVQRQQEKLKSAESGMMGVISKRMDSMEAVLMQRIVQKESEVKKGLNVIMGKLKAKERLLLDKSDQVKKVKVQMKELEVKEKGLIERIKIVEKRQKELKVRDNSGALFKKANEVNELKVVNQKLKEEIKQLQKKHKNLDLAYKKVKHENNKLLSDKKQTQENQRTSTVTKATIKQVEEIDLDRLELSSIVPPQFCIINPVKMMGKKDSQSNKAIKGIETDRDEELMGLQQILNKQEIKFEPVYTSQSQKSEQDDDESVPVACLAPSPTKNAPSLLESIRQIEFQSDQQKLQFLKQGKLQAIMKQCKEQSLPQQLIETVLELMIELIERGQHYSVILSHLCSPFGTTFLQQCYLGHETVPDIAQTTTLILSRMRLGGQAFDMTSAFTQALQLRSKIQPKSSLLSGNINFLLS